MCTSEGLCTFQRTDGPTSTPDPQKPQPHSTKIGRYSRDEPLGSAVKLSNGRVFRLSEENDIERTGFWKPVRGKGKPVLACLNSGIGQYLITYPTVMGIHTNSKVYLLEGKFTR